MSCHLFIDTSKASLILNEDGGTRLDHTGETYNYTKYCIHHVVEDADGRGIYHVYIIFSTHNIIITQRSIKLDRFNSPVKN